MVQTRPPTPVWRVWANDRTPTIYIHYREPRARRRLQSLAQRYKNTTILVQMLCPDGTIQYPKPRSTTPRRTKDSYTSEQARRAALARWHKQEQPSHDR